MESIKNFSVETANRAHELLLSDTEMLHVFSRPDNRCAHCSKHRGQVRFDEECAALLRCALDMVKAYAPHVAA